MAQVLSQDEVDALLNAVNDGGTDSFSGGGDSGGSSSDDSDENIQTYDLTNQDRVIR